MHNNYKLLKEEFIKEINSKAQLLEHIKSGARVVLFLNDDENKVFQIGFKTPPTDDTGVPHIMEHSTLCGSRKYPVKEPFVELLKGSLNTFLNAITFGDKTIYPVASCNDKDFANLMDVYLDAVFYPNVYKHEEIFKQEGWHYELDNLDGDITYNGVVYNEMKGAFSSPDQVVARASLNSLFPDTAYGVESGGDPEAIPTLTYEAFKNFHSKFYSPSNSYIALYGNFDPVERMEYLDKEYLSKFDKIEVDSFIPYQEPFKEHKELNIYYPVGRDESLDDKTFYTFNAVVGKFDDIETVYAMTILTHILLNMPGAPLKQALLNAGIAKDIIGNFENSQLQPVFSIGAMSAKENKLDEFKGIIRSTLEGIVKSGIDKRVIEAAINFFEFQFREGDASWGAKGLVYIVQAYNTWLYDDNNPFALLKFDGIFKFLREKINTSYYEELIKEYLLDNNHVSYVVCSPSQTLNEEREQKLKEKLAKFKATLSKAELEKMIEDTKALKAYQATPNTKEELDTIPLLSKEDIKENLPKILNKEEDIDGVKVLRHEYATNGISYFTFAFSAKGVKRELVPYLGILSSLLGMVDTENHSYQDLATDVMINTGGVGSEVTCYSKGDEINPFFEVSAKVLPEKIDFVYNIVKEIVTTSRFTDKKHVCEVLSMIKSNLQMGIIGRGHSTAANRALSYYNKAVNFSDLCRGIGYYKFLEDLESNIDSRYDELVRKLEEVMHIVFRRENLIINYTSLDENYKPFVKDFGEALFKDKVETKEFTFTPTKDNEGFKTSSQVQFCALVGSYKEIGKYEGGLKVLAMALNYDYLWTNIRVLGGAYGFLLRFTQDADILLGSYRDPNLSKTYETFKGIANYIRNLELDDTELLKYIIGAVGDITYPLTPKEKGGKSFASYIKGVGDDYYHNEFMEIVNVNKDNFKKYADYFDCVVNQNYVCTIGNEKKIEEEKNLFKEVKSLIK